MASQQTWPVWKVIAWASCSAVCGRSTSSKTTAAPLPPSSSLTGTRFRPQAAADQPADFGRAGERHPLQARMRRQRRAGRIAKAGHDVDHAVGNADFAGQAGQVDRRQRRVLGRLDDHRVAGRQRRRNVPADQQNGKIPGEDESARAPGHAGPSGPRGRRPPAGCGAGRARPCRCSNAACR